MTTPNSPDTPPGRQAPPPSENANADDLVADIEATRADLGDTVDALSQKLDVKTQAQNTFDDARQRATEQAHLARDRGTEMFNQAKDAATDDQGNVTPEAKSTAIQVGAVLAALIVIRAVWKKVRR